MNTGETYIFFVPPGWLLGGTIRLVDDEYIVIDDACYLESAGADRSTIGDVALATSAEEQQRACTLARALPDGFVLRREGILLASPCAMHLRALVRSRDADALRGAR